jgi:lysophospholipid acyltransferase (LPLAT)-like uncharacterized protein
MATPAFIKNFSRNAAARALSCRLCLAFVRFVHATSRWDTVGEEHVRPFWEEGKPAIVCFWHGRLMMLPYAWKRSLPFHMLMSPHADGQLGACLAEGLGIHVLAGSSGRGGAEGLRRMVQLLRTGATVGITPDGPRGPRMRASDGAIALARLSGVPLLPVAFGCRRRRLLGSWDRFVVALPFTKGVFVWGAPIAVARDADSAALEAVRLRLERELTQVTDTADRLTGQTTVEAAPMPAAAEAHS